MVTERTVTLDFTPAGYETSDKRYGMRSEPSVLSVFPSVEIGGVRFDAITMETAVARIVAMAKSEDKYRYLCTGNLDHLALLQNDPIFQEVYANADMILADGMPIVWLSRLRKWRNQQQIALPERVAGSDLIFQLGEMSAQEGLRLFYLGGIPGAAERAAALIQKRYPGAIICGTYCPPRDRFASGDEQRHIQSLIHEANPHILFVGLGAPKQEKWIAEHRESLRVPMSIGVGGSFEMACGMVRRAPIWMQKCGMEWSYRLMQEPNRLWKRYIGRDLPLLSRLVVQTLFRLKQS